MTLETSPGSVLPSTALLHAVDRVAAVHRDSPKTGEIGVAARRAAMRALIAFDASDEEPADPDLALHDLLARAPELAC